MEFLSEIFIKFWKEVIVAVMLTAILPFIRAYVRRQRAKMLNFFREKECLKKSLLEEETKRKEAEAEIERLRAALKQEQKAREEAEQKYQAELQEKDEIRRKAASIYDTLMQEQKAHKELEQKYQAEAEEKRKAQEEVKTLRISLEQERNARQEAWRKSKEEIYEEAPKPTKKSYLGLVREIIDNHLDLNHIYDCLDAITTDYPNILKEKYSELFEILYKHRPHTLYALFAHYATRPYYTLNEKERKNVYENHLYFSKASSPQEYTYFPEHEADVAHNKRWYLIISGLWKYEYERKYRSNILPSVHKKLSYANTLIAITRGIFVRQAGDKGCIIDKKHPFLKVFAYNSDSEYDWLTVEPSDKKFMLFYGDDLLVSVAGSYTHHDPVSLEYVSLDFPILNGIDASGYLTCSDGKTVPIASSFSFCYVEAR